MILLVGSLRDAPGALGASGIVGNVQAVFVMCWIGLLVAASVTVGHAIGAGDIQRAKIKAVNVGVAGIHTHTHTHIHLHVSYTYARARVPTHSLSRSFIHSHTHTHIFAHTQHWWRGSWCV